MPRTRKEVTRAMPIDTAHILVVDDDQRLRDLLDRFLTDNGYNVTTAGDATRRVPACGACVSTLWGWIA